MDAVGEDIAKIFEEDSKLPGILVFENAQFIGMIPRYRFYEQLGRPFGTEIFLRRSIRELLVHLGVEKTIIPITAPINEAVRIAFSRPEGQRYDPLVIQTNENDFQIVDMHSLLSALSNTYEKMNIVIRKQMEIGKALSSSIDTPHLLSFILEQIQEILPSHASAIFLEKEREKQVDAYTGILDPETTCFLFDRMKEYIRCKCDNSLDEPCIIHFEDSLSFSYQNIKIQTPISAFYFPLIYGDDRLGYIYALRFPESVPSKGGDSEDEFPNSFVASPLQPFTEIDIRNMMGLENIITTAIRNSHLLTQIRELANTDSLTNIYNRRGFFSEARNEIESAQTKKRALCALIIDIDHFKNVNDTYGHASGDDVIRAIVLETRKTLRNTDLIGRYGGEEFVVLLPDSELDVARAVAERIRRNIAKLKIPTKTGTVSVTVSIGISQFDQRLGSLDALLMRADQALNIAKSSGRNQIMIWNKTFSWKTINNACTPNYLTQIDKSQIIYNSSPLTDEEIHSLEDAIDDLIHGYVHALELRDKETEGHAQRVMNITVPLSEKMGLRGEELMRVRRGALLHDIGKIAIPDDILLKPGPLTEKERFIMERHPRYAYDLLSTNVFLKDYLDIPYCHHEHWDGCGYPRHLRGEEIPLPARIFTLVDVWDALLSDRPYRKAWKEKEVYTYIRDQSGKIFDPRIVEMFFEFINETKK